MSQANAPFSFCNRCGSAYPPGSSFPKSCGRCSQTIYKNPLPVAVALIPCETGLLGVTRGIQPGYGKDALPGGFMEVNETAEQAAARETLEETGLSLDASVFKYAGSAFNAHGNLMLFYKADIEPIALPTLIPNDETLALRVIQPGDELAFPLHAAAVQTWFDERDNAPVRSRAPGR